MWYPGHVARAKRKIAELLKAVNFVIEIRDARAPYATGAYERREILKGKRSIIVLNKADIAQEDITNGWVEFFRSRNERVVVTWKRDRSARLLREIFGERMSAKALVIGLPNVGKSAFINRIKGRRSVKVGRFPGVTRGVQSIQINDRIKILDTPGIVYTELFSKKLVAKLLLVGAVMPEMVEDWKIFEMAFSMVNERYPGVVSEKVGKVSSFDEAVLEFGRRRNMLMKGGEIDTNNALQKMFHEIASGKWGKMSFETPQEVIES